MENPSAFYILCDESRVENKDSEKMVIGALLLSKNNKNKVRYDLKSIYKKYEFNFELKWTKTSNKYLKFYDELITYFLKNDDLSYRAIVVDKTKVDYEVYHDNDKELAFFKFYYLLLRNLLHDNCIYYILLDRKPTRDRNRARALKSFLDSHSLFHKNLCTIKHLQAYSSKENVLLQFSDFLTGLVGYANNRHREKTTKNKVYNSAESLLKQKLTLTTPLSNKKFNILVWENNR